MQPHTITSRAPSNIHRPLADKFLERINFDGPIPEHCPELGPCWLWTGAPYGNGYGRIANEDGKQEPAHRVAWRLYNGPIPDGLDVLHHCDTKLCVNTPGGHHFLGNKTDNMRDMAAKGRRSSNSIPRSILMVSSTIKPSSPKSKF